MSSAAVVIGALRVNIVQNYINTAFYLALGEFTTVWANSVDDKLMIFFFMFFFFFFLKKTGFDIPCKLSPLETLCIKYQILFSRENKKKISICHVLNILPRVLSINGTEKMKKWWYISA